MDTESNDVSELLDRAGRGDRAALDELFSRYRERLMRMVALRLDRRLHGRLDASDVIQEAYLDIMQKLDEYLRDPQLPLYLWLRHITGLKLAEVHRRHLGTEKRNAAYEVSLHRGPLPEASTASLALQLVGRLTSPSDAAMKAELRIKVQEALNSLDSVDREILAMRHFEQLTTSETAQVLGLSKSGAGSRYLRAIKRLKQLVGQMPGFDQL